MPSNLAGRAGFEPAHGVSNSHVPFQLGYRPKSRRPRFWSGPSEIESELGNLTNGQTNPEGPARLTHRLIMDLVCIVISKPSIAPFQPEATTTIHKEELLFSRRLLPRSTVRCRNDADDQHRHHREAAMSAALSRTVELNLKRGTNPKPRRLSAQ